MRLAADEITVMVEGRTLYLRPSLRAAARLERRYGFPALYTGVAEGNVTIITDLIRAGANDPSFELFGHGIGAFLAGATTPLFAFVMMLNGLDDEEPATDETTARITFAEHYERLFRLATGWLGWTPDEALNATPNEIREAYLGRVDMLKAIFGGSDKPDPGDEPSLDDKISSGLRRLRPFVAKEAA